LCCNLLRPPTLTPKLIPRLLHAFPLEAMAVSTLLDNMAGLTAIAFVATRCDDIFALTAKAAFSQFFATSLILTTVTDYTALVRA